MRRLISRFLAASLVPLVVCAGCKREAEAGDSPGDESASFAPGPQSNRLEGLPGEIHRSQADSPIHWQPWTKDSMKLAGDSGRLVLAVVALPQQPTFRDLVGKLERDQTTVRDINDFSVPILVDGDAVREFGLLTSHLCGEIGSGLQLPLMVWMTSKGNPVAWIPLPSSGADSVSELFSQSHEMVNRMWNEDPGYILKNSTMDQGNRRSRLNERREELEVSTRLRADSLRALRQLTSLYDPASRTFDEAGSLFPCGAINLLVLGARTERIPDELREKCREVLEFLLDDLLPSPMFDPLDGGVFSSRRGISWELPGFYRDCSLQARVAASLFDAYSVTGDERALDRALGVMEFVNNEYVTAEGLYALGTGIAGDTSKWLWRFEDLKGLLTETELAWWVAATGVEETGNLPSEVDPLREYFRENSLSYKKSSSEVALAFGVSQEEVKASLESARKKLLKVRSERLKYPDNAVEANAAATFRMVSAFASAYRITGREEYLEKAQTTLEKAREHFSKGPRLQLYRSDAPASLVTGRAFLYGLALQAALDVSATSLDERWLMWADDIGTTSAELFAANGYLRECPADADIMDLPISDVSMLFDESTAGLLFMSQARLEPLGRPLLAKLADIVSRLPMSAIDSPILHSDVIQAALMKEYGVTYVYGPGLAAESRKALARMPLRGVNLRAAGQGAETEADAILKIPAGGKAVLVNDLRNELDPVLLKSLK